MLKIESLGPEQFFEDEESDGPKDFDEEKSSKLDELEQRRREAELVYGSEDDVAGPAGVNWANLENDDGPQEYTITKLTPGVRDPNRVNVFLDGRFAFSLDVTQVIDLEVKRGQKISPERLAELKKASEFGKLYQRTLEWAITRPHSVREARDYLRRRQIKRRQLNRQREREEKKALPEFEDDVVQLVLDRLIEKRYLNDTKFAEFYVENRYVRRGISQKRLRMELHNKGVASEIAEAALAKIPRDEDEEILKVIAKKRKKYNDFQLVGYLTRQGFNFQKAKDAVENWHED